MLEVHPDSFHGSMKPFLILAQICGLLPIRGIFGKKIWFTWRNPAIVYGFAIFAVTLFFDSCYTIDNFNTAIRIDVFASTVFYTTCLLTTLFFLEIGKKFEVVAEEFVRVDRDVAEEELPRRIGVKMKLFLLPFIFISIIEHGTLALINMNSSWKNSRSGNHSFGYFFYVTHFPAISRRLPYSGIGTIVLFWVNAMCTFNWNYLDFFLVGISLEISSRFALINSRLGRLHLMKKKEERKFWRKMVQHYNSMSILTKKLDKLLWKVIMTSFFSNLYHLSLQLVRSLTVKGTLFQMTYFYFSMTYLISRLLLVLFFASNVNEESKRPSEILFSRRNPSAEEIRFLHQVLTDEVAFTGNKFFVITRKFVVSVIGTVVTYQVFLLQFNSLKYN